MSFSVGYITKVWYLCIVMRTVSLRRLTILPQFVQYDVRNCEGTLMQLWKWFAVLPLRSACLAMHQTTMKTKGQQLQRACKARWLSSEATLRARSEVLGICAALKQLSENKNDAMCVVLLRLIKTKKLNMAPFVNTGTSPDNVFQARCFNFAQVKASVELCINKLSDAGAKSELKVHCEKIAGE